MLWRRKKNGQAYVEFLLVLPLFLIIIVGMVAFGQLLYTKLAVEAAAWASARQAISTLNQGRGLGQVVPQAHLAAMWSLQVPPCGGPRTVQLTAGSPPLQAPHEKSLLSARSRG